MRLKILLLLFLCGPYAFSRGAMLPLVVLVADGLRTFDALVSDVLCLCPRGGGAVNALI